MTLKRILIALILASISFGIGAYYRFNRIIIPVKPTEAPPAVVDPTSNDEKGDDPLPEQLNISGRINILVLGEDNIDRVKRSDTMMLVAVDIDQKNVRVLSLPRDTRVQIQGRGYQKLNHAYAYGKIDLLRSTIERFLGTNIHYYIKIDYDNFPQLVDLVGGVDIFVGRAMKYTDRKQKLYIDIPAGKQRMNGETALKYVRFRNDAMGDIGRIRRQQQFLKGFLHRIYETENLMRFPTVIEGIRNTIMTDMDPSMILQLGSFIRKLEDDQNKIFFKMLPGQPAIVDGLSYWVSDTKDVTAFLMADAEELINGQKDVSTAADFSPEDPKKLEEAAKALERQKSTEDVKRAVSGITQGIAILNGTGRGGAAHSVATHLQKMGVEVVHTGNAKHFDYRSSIVIFPEGAPIEMRRCAENLATLCGIPASLTRADKQAAYASIVVGHNYETLLKKLEQNYALFQ